MKNIVVLISGSGSNLQAIMDAVNQFALPARIVAVISNRPGAYGLERAKKAGIEIRVVDHKQFSSREAFDAMLRKEIDAFSPDIVALAGFMRILTPAFVDHYLGKMVNIHPSLLPKFTGLHTHARAIEAGEKQHGATVHYVTADLDGGPPILQGVVDILPTDSPEQLAARVLEKEHIIYPTVIDWLTKDMLELRGKHVYLAGNLIPDTGLKLEELPDKFRLGAGAPE